MQLVPCPNGGKCGSRNHRPDSAAYRKCLESSTRDSSKGAGAANLALPGYVKSGLLDGSYANLVKEIERHRVYSAAESFVNKDTVIPEHMVQTYINNPDEVNELCRGEWEEYIQDDIQGKGDEIAAKLGLNVDDLDDAEFDTLVKAVFDSDRYDIAGAMAKNMGPRTFSTPVSLPRKEMALQEANRQFSFGTDGWFESVAYRYWTDMTGMDGRLDDPGRRSLDGYSSVKHQIEQKIRDAVEKRGGVVASADDLPDFSVVWTSTLDDISPAINKERLVEVDYPFLVASYSDTGAVGDPVKLNAGYRIGYEEIPSFIGDPRISMSQIVDERTSDNGVLNLSGKDTIEEYSAMLSTL